VAIRILLIPQGVHSGKGLANELCGPKERHYQAEESRGTAEGPRLAGFEQFLTGHESPGLVLGKKSILCGREKKYGKSTWEGVWGGGYQRGGASKVIIEERRATEVEELIGSVYKGTY